MVKEELVKKLKCCASSGSCLRCEYAKGCDGISSLMNVAAFALENTEAINCDERIRLNSRIASLENRLRTASKMVQKFMEDWNEN